MRRAAIVVLGMALAACGAGKAGGAGGADAGSGASSDSGGGCFVSLSYNPPQPVADPLAPIRVVAAPTVSGFWDYSWHVSDPDGQDVAYTPEASDGSQISFVAAVTGTYTVSVDVTGGPSYCPGDTVKINVGSAGANLTDYRVRVVAPGDLAPPQDTIVQLQGGADVDRPFPVDPGVELDGAVLGGGAGIPAYVRFMPVASPTAAVETFSDASGRFSVRVLGQGHAVLVVPEVAGFAPKLLSWSPGTTTLSVGPGTVVTGAVLDGGGAGLAGAKVQLEADGAPSTIATTDATGHFSLRADYPTGATVSVEVTPPAGRGLPRLAASAAFDLTSALQIQYAALPTCDLGGTPVRRAGAGVANAKVTLVGQLAAGAGTVTAGGTQAGATGTVQIATTTNGAGALASTLAPSAPLSAVVTVASGDLAVATVDASACTPSPIAAPAMAVASGVVQDGQGVALGGAQLEATPHDGGPLARAGAPAITAVADGSGAFALRLAAGAAYDVRISDPAGRAAPRVLLGVTAADVPAQAVLPAALALSGDVSVLGSANPVPGASVQVLCATCSGLDAARPLAEAATDRASHFQIAVPDPGTM